MSDNKNKSSKSRLVSSKAPPQIVNFFSKPLSPNYDRSPSTSPSDDRKRKLSEQVTSSRNETPSTYAETLQKDAAKISKIQKAKKVGTLVSTFFQQGNSDDLSDFESPRKRMQFKAPPVIPKKKVTRKRKLPTKQNKISDALETEIFEKVLIHHSNANDLNSDDLQMAIALSKSLEDTQSSTGDYSNISSTIRNAEPFRKEDIVRQTFQKFGFKKRDNNDYDYRNFFANGGTNKKWLSKFTPLTRRSENIQKEKFKKKVKNILQMSEAIYCFDSEVIQNYGVTSSYLQQLSIPNSPSYNISLTAMEASIANFYCNDLFPISTVRCGCLLKNWADIPGRDVSPQRNASVSCDVDETNESSEIHQYESRSGKTQQDKIIDLPKCDVGYVLEPSSTVTEAVDPTESTKCQELRNCDQILQSLATEEADVTDLALEADTNVKVDSTIERQPSPDMFADYESSANNSLHESSAKLNDDVVLDERIHTAENYVAAKATIIAEDCGYSDTSQCKSINASINENYQICGSGEVLVRCDDSIQVGAKIAESSSETLQQKLFGIPFVKRLSFIERLELYNSDSALENLNNDQITETDPSSQDSMVISDDEINYSSNHCRVDDGQSVVNGHPINMQESIQLSDSEDDTEERQSFASLDIGNENDFAGEKSLDINDEIWNSNHSFNDEDLINLTTGGMCRRELVSNSIKSPMTNNFVTNHSTINNQLTLDPIELSDSESDQNEMASQLPEDDIEERQSFASLDVGNENRSASEKSLDINIDDEIVNSNHSSDDEDLINLSVREMCQKEFVSGSAKPSTSTNFSRTMSDMTFERKVWKPAKTPFKFNNCSDDEFDEFDKLVRGNNKCQSPIPDGRSIEISDDEFETSVERRHSCDGLSVSPKQSNEFMVQSMDQIYEVRTGVLVTPKPDYERMDSPTRLEHLRKYGLKTLSKRKAVICLEYIYNQLHPSIELDAHDDLNKILSQRGVHAIDSGKRIDDMATPSETGKPLAENHFDVLQENEDTFYLPSAPRAKKPWCLMPLHVAWHNLMQSNGTLYDTVLQYKPVDLVDIRSRFKSIDLRYETNDIISFLDRKCITFKTDNKRK